MKEHCEIQLMHCLHWFIFDLWYLIIIYIIIIYIFIIEILFASEINSYIEN